MTRILLGADPELFLKIGDNFMTAAGFFPGTKHEPYKLDGGASQVDGMALEYNIDPAETEDEWEKNHAKVLAQLEEMVKMVDKDMQIVYSPVATFEHEYWQKVPAEAKILGCDPDFNIYGQQNENPGDKIESIPIRTAAGHIHIGWTEGKRNDDVDFFEDCLSVARYFHSSEIYRPQTDIERVRLSYYGMNGSFRCKKYGVELRSPSNLWVANEQSRREMYRKTRETFRTFANM